ncbi:MAG: thioredoxin-dependent thiol peroxidase [Campylobacteraceae bacterium]
MIEVGKEAPLFCLPNQDDVEICLRDLKGKWVILYFYPKDNTPGCTTEACEFSASLPNFEDLNAVIVGISPDSTKSHQKFIEKKDLKFTLLSDEKNEVSTLYDVWKLKKLYGREYMGIERSTFLVDPKGKVAYIWRKVKVNGHVSEVGKILSGLQK